MFAGDPHDRGHLPGLTTLTRRRALGAGLTAAAAGMLGIPAARAGATPRATPAEETQVVRTPETRFDGLVDYPFTPHYVEIDAGDSAGTRLRVHYVDERPGDPVKASGETILLVHGEPSWSYQYRHVIPSLVAAGHRCVALDLVGFGKSDKPTNRFAYTYQRHMDWLRETVFDRLDLRDVTMVCHDWGGMLGLRLVAEHPDRFRRVVASNTGLDTGDEDLGPAWQYMAQWLQFTQRIEQFEPAQVVQNFTVSELDPAVLDAYNAPFPDDAYLHGVRRFPLLIPISPDDEASEANRRAWAILETLQTPFLCVFSDKDHVTGGDHTPLSGRIPGAADQPHTTIMDAAHFVQEDQGAEFAAVVNDFIRSTR